MDAYLSLSFEELILYFGTENIEKKYEETKKYLVIYTCLFQVNLNGTIKLFLVIILGGIDMMTIVSAFYQMYRFRPYSPYCKHKE